MPDVSEAQLETRVREVLGAVKGLDGRDIVSSGVVSAVVVKSGNVHIVMEIEQALAERMEPVRKAAEESAAALPGVISATAVLTAAAKPATPPGGPARPRTTKLELPGVRTLVAVASGKGGVGKSTVAVNLALALRNKGLKVGVLDADIYGPSIPRLLGIRGTPESDGETIQPMVNYGVKCMSIGFLVDEETPMIWRGPMVQSAIEQMLRDVAWGELDVLVVDLPPGTGDAQLTMAQRVPLTGAVIVSTPQDLALLDARKGLNMFRKVEVPVLGIVENMSYFICPHCGGRSDIFSHGGAQKEALRLGTDFLGEVPLDMAIRETSDGGAPLTATEPDHPLARPFALLADKVWAKLAALVERPERQAPRIVVE
jgi:ATP-binding protein involved in chromosome partitioning